MPRWRRCWPGRRPRGRTCCCCWGRLWTRSTRPSRAGCCRKPLTCCSKSRSGRAAMPGSRVSGHVPAPYSLHSSTGQDAAGGLAALIREQGRPCFDSGILHVAAPNGMHNGKYSGIKALWTDCCHNLLMSRPWAWFCTGKQRERFGGPLTTWSWRVVHGITTGLPPCNLSAAHHNGQDTADSTSTAEVCSFFKRTLDCRCSAG